MKDLRIQQLQSDDRWFRMTCIMFIFFLIYVGYQLFFSTPNLIDSLDEMNDLSSDFPIKGANYEEMIKNSDVHYKYHDSHLSLISVVVATVAAILTFLAFYVQFKFNQKQSKDITKERYENQFFHMMDVYRQICNSTYIPNVGKGKTAFHYMFYEYKAMLFMLKDEDLLKGYDNQFKHEMIFSMFLDGVSRTKKTDDATQEKKRLLNERLLELQYKSESHNGTTIIDQGVNYIKDYQSKNVKYFDGHRLRLIPYFNYILLILEFIEKNQKHLHADGFNALPFLSAEMTEHEIGLLYTYTRLAGINIESEEIWTLINGIVDTLPKSNADRFKYDNKGFF